MKYAILAAGHGSRLANEGITTPKPLITINGQPLIDRLIQIFLQNQADQIAIIANNLAPQTAQHLQTLQQQGAPIQLVVQNTPSSMHSLYALTPLLQNQPFILTTVDTIFQPAEFSNYVNTFTSSPHLHALMGVTSYIDDESPLYVSTNPTTLQITGFHDTLNDYHNANIPNSQCTHISAGIYALTPATLPTLQHTIASGQTRMRNFQRALVADNLTLQAHPFSKVIDLDHAADIPKAEQLLQQQ